jgi:antirestriction protein ArdC
MNQMILGITAMLEDYDSNVWGTYAQIAKHGGQVAKGQKSTSVILWKPFDGVDKDGQEVKRFFMTTFNVFNVAQAEWTGERPGHVVKAEHDSIADAEAIANAYLTNGPTFSTGGDRAFYRPSTDSIKVPEIGYFDNAEAYYSTLFHEITHSTGHKTRLDRDGVTEGHVFGDADYSREELIAEMGAAFLCAEAGINPESTMTNSAAYVQNWLKVLKGDSKIIVEAAGKAQKACDHVMGSMPTEEEIAA